MKKNKIKRFPFLLVFTVCIVSAFAFLMATTNSNITNLIATDPNTEFNITYDLKDGKFEENTTAPTKYKYIEETSIPNPVKDGSEFLGWTINDKTDTQPVKDYKIPKGTTGDVKLTANWKVLQVKLMDGKTFNDTIKRMSDFYNVTKIQFVKGTPNQRGTDVSEAQDRSIMASIEGDVLTVASENTIYANENSANTFFGAEYYYIESYIESIDLSNFDTSNVTDMESMFYGCNSLTSIKGLENFDTSQVTNMSQMFYDCAKIRTLNVSNFDTSNVANMSDMFSMCDLLSDIKGLENFNTSQVTTMESMFYGCDSLTSLNLSNWNTSNVIRAGSMFSFCSGLRTIDLSNWNTRNLKVVASMFDKCKNLETIKGLNNFDTSNTTHFAYMFQDCNKLSGSITIANPNVSEQYGYGDMFLNCSTVSPAKFVVNYTDNSTKTVAQKMVNTKGSGNVVLGGMPSTLITGKSFNTTIEMMSGFENVTEIRFEQKNGTLSGTDVSEAKDGSIKARISGNVLYVEANGEIFANKNCGQMFHNLGSGGISGVLDKIIFNNFNTSKVTDMSWMFNNCELLTSIDVSNFNTSKVTDMSNMLQSCESLTNIKGLENFDTSQVTNMNQMFMTCNKLTSIDVSNFDTSKVTNMRYMFAGCSSLPSLNVSRFNTSNVTNMSDMFAGCSSLTSIDVSNFDTSQVIYIGNMFKNCPKLNGSITIMNPNITNYYDSMFYNCSTDSNTKFIVKYVDEATKAVAEKLVATKSENSNVFLYETAKLVDGKTFNEELRKLLANAYSSDPTYVYFVNKSQVDSSLIQSGAIDVSEAQDGSIKMYAIYGGLGQDPRVATYNKIIVVSDKFIIANENSSYMFYTPPLHEGKSYDIDKIDFDNFDTSEVTNMSYMFADMGIGGSIWSIYGLENFDTSKVEDMSYMFHRCPRLNGEMTIMNPNLNKYESIFFNTSTSKDTKFIVKYIDDATKEVARKMVETKFSTGSLCNVYLDGTQPIELATLVDGTTFNTKLIEVMENANSYDPLEIYFVKKSQLSETIPQDAVDVSEAQDGSIKMYASYNEPNKANTRVPSQNKIIIVSEQEIFTNENSSNMLNVGSWNLTVKQLDNFNTSKTTDMSYMFYGCNVYINSDDLDISNATNISHMFEKCDFLDGEITINNSNITSYTDMFKNSATNSFAKFIVKYVDEETKKVATGMVATKSDNSNVYLYEESTSSVLLSGAKFNEKIMSSLMSVDGEGKHIIFEKGDVTNLPSDAYSITDVSEAQDGSIIMYSKRSSNKYIITPITDTEIHIVSPKTIEFNEDCSNMFSLENKSSYKINSIEFNNIDTSKVKNMSRMFKSNYYLNELDLSNFDTSKVTDMSSMFENCSNLSGNIKISNHNILSYSNMFKDCSTDSTARFVVNYQSGYIGIAQALVNTKSSNSNVSLSNRDHTGGNSNDVPNDEEPSVPDTVILTIKDGNTVTTKEILAGEIGSLNTPSKEGMIFSGYFYDKEFTKLVSERDVISEDTTIYIKWEEVPQVEEAPQEENKDESLEVA